MSEAMKLLPLAGQSTRREPVASDAFEGFMMQAKKTANLPDLSPSEIDAPRNVPRTRIPIGDTVLTVSNRGNSGRIHLDLPRDAETGLRPFVGIGQNASNQQTINAGAVLPISGNNVSGSIRYQKTMAPDGNPALSNDSLTLSAESGKFSASVTIDKSASVDVTAGYDVGSGEISFNAVIGEGEQSIGYYGKNLTVELERSEEEIRGQVKFKTTF